MRIIADNIKQKDLIESILKELSLTYCKGLSLNYLNSIVVSGDLSKEVSGRYSKGEMYINRIYLNETMEKIHGIVFIPENVLKMDFVIQRFIDTIIHELYHCNAEFNMPRFHNYTYNEFSDDESLWKKCIIHYWIECFVNYNSNKNSYLQNDELMDQITDINWNIRSFYNSKNVYENMNRLIYISSYYVSLFIAYGYKNNYLNLINDKCISQLYKNLITETIKLLIQNKYIDDYKELSEINRLFREYYESLNIL